MMREFWQSDSIRVENIPVYSYVGALPEERSLGQHIFIDLDLELAYSRASETDELVDTVHYGEAVEKAKAVCETSKRQLIEAMAADVADCLLQEFPSLWAVTVTIHKPSAPITSPFGDVMVKIRRQAQEMVILALGSNMGDSKAVLKKAAKELKEHEEISHFRLSSLYGSKAWGKEDQADFVNAVAIFETTLSPWQLLKYCQELEKRAGRVRTETWGPRILDLDIISYGKWKSTDPELLLPHPYAEERIFVQLPLAELEGKSIQDSKECWRIVED